MQRYLDWLIGWVGGIKPGGRLYFKRILAASELFLPNSMISDRLIFKVVSCGLVAKGFLSITNSRWRSTSARSHDRLPPCCGAERLIGIGDLRAATSPGCQIFESQNGELATPTPIAARGISHRPPPPLSWVSFLVVMIWIISRWRHKRYESG